MEADNLKYSYQDQKLYPVAIKFEPFPKSTIFLKENVLLPTEMDFTQHLYCIVYC